MKTDKVNVANEVFTTMFSCDYERCKGACCWASSSADVCGGKLTLSEAKEIREKKLTVSTYSPFPQKVRTKPVQIDGVEHFTVLTENGQCLFSDKEAKTCVIKKAHAEGKISFPIPVHCSLYPLTIYKSNGQDYLYISDLWDEHCKPAFEKGKQENMPVFRFCRESIIRIYGQEFYDSMEEHYKTL